MKTQTLWSTSDSSWNSYLTNIATGTTSIMSRVTRGDRPTWVRPEYRNDPATPAPPVPEDQPPTMSLRAEKKQHLSLKTRVESGTGSLRVYLEKKTVRDRKDNSPSPELILAEITPAGTQSQTIRLKGTLLIE